MTPGTLFPSFFRVDYHSAYAPHAMLIPTLAWYPTSITGTLGSYATHNAGVIDAEEMVNDLVDKLAVFHLSTTIFDLATVFTMASPTAPAIPKASASLSQVGSSISTYQAKAVQNVFVFRGAGGSKLKLYLMDSPTIGGTFEKVPAGAWNTAMNDVFAQINNSSAAWCTRQDEQVVTKVSVTSTLNEKLRKEYRMA